MAILVIGGTGFIGPRLIRRLIDRGEAVVCKDLNPGAVSPFAAMPSKAELIRGDVTRFDDVMRTVLQVKPDRLINLAYGLGAGEGNPHQVMRLDILGRDNCFEAARLGGVKQVVYASSIAVSGQQSHFGDRPATEDDPPHGTSQYAVHKAVHPHRSPAALGVVGVVGSMLRDNDSMVSIIGHEERSPIMPVTLPQSVKKLLQDKAYGHVVTFNAQGKPQLTMVWMDVDGDEVLFNTAEGRKKPQNLRRDSRIIVSVQDRTDPQAYAVFHGNARITETGADDHIDKLAKRFLNADKYPFRQPGEKRLIVRISIDRIGGFGPKMQPWS